MVMTVAPFRKGTAGVIAVAGLSLLALISGSTGTWSQSLGGVDSVLGLANTPMAPATRMLVEADTLIYDLDNNTIAAVGSVVIYYGPYTLVANRVDVDRTTKRVLASGSVELTDAEGNVLTSEQVDLTDDLRNGVAEGLEIITSQRTAFTATRATRINGDQTVFQDGVYLPCVDCNGEAGRKPIWNIRAKRIIHRQGEKTITYEDATFEFLGVPIAWVPVLSQPDPSVRRKSGFLAPSYIIGDKLGFGLSAPYFYAIAPDMDVTIAPGYFTRQGPFLDVEWRQRIDSGSYSLRVAGINQNEPDAFAGTSGDKDFRGSLESVGRFNINERWNWGWDVGVATDRSFFNDYERPGANNDSTTNQVFITGVDGRNRFNGEALSFFVQQEDSNDPGARSQFVDLQSKQPIVHPVIDHEVYAPGSVWGGELSFKSNLTSLSRQRTDVYEFPGGSDERLRGASGTFTRASIDSLWRRRIVDSMGQVFTPFAYVQGDVYFSAPRDESGSVTLTEDAVGARAMPAVGLEYSFPFLFSSKIGSQVIEPIAQLIVRPDETETGRIPNEDAQSLVFDASSLFEYDKFSGFDRVEGGTRVNLGFRYSAQFVNGMSLDGSVGQSIQLAGQNSYSIDTRYDTGVDSGLDEDVSDYVATLSLNTNRGLLFSGSARIDQEDFSSNRIEAQVLGLSGPLTAALTYAFIREQPDFGIEDDRSEIQAAASLRLDENWRLFGSTRFDIENSDLVRQAMGFAYDAEEFSLSLSYSEDYATSDEDVDRTVYLRVGFRTLGDVGTQQGLGD